MSKLILHLGYPKTGTSTLQNAVFETLYQARHIRYLGMGGFPRDTSPARRDFFVALTAALYIEDEADFQAKLPALRADYVKLVSSLAGNGPIVLSNEHFLYSSWSSRQVNARIFPERSAARLGQVFERAQVSLMIGTRDLPELMRSVYVQIRSNKSHVNHRLIDKTLADFVHRICARQDFQSEMFLFKKNEAHFKDAFPDAPLLTLAFDDFVSRQRDSVADILAFIGLPETALEAFDFPLQHSNAKVKTDQGTVVENIPPYLRAFARNDFMSPLLRRMSKAGPFKALRRVLLRKEELPNLTDAQRREIEKSFETD